MIITQLQGYQDPPNANPLVIAKPLAATLAAPTFSGQFGGAVTNPYNFAITNPNGATGTLYYSVNGADPRDIGGGINPGRLTGTNPINVTLTSTSTVRARVYDSANVNVECAHGGAVSHRRPRIPVESRRVPNSLQSAGIGAISRNSLS